MEEAAKLYKLAATYWKKILKDLEMSMVDTDSIENMMEIETLAVEKLAKRKRRRVVVMSANTKSPYQHKRGIHCITTAMANILSGENIDLSEELCFGIGSGLGFTYTRGKASSNISSSVEVMI